MNRSLYKHYSVKQDLFAQHASGNTHCERMMPMRSHLHCCLYRAFSGTLISHDVFIALDVVWLAGVLKPILDHKGVIENNEGRQVKWDARLLFVNSPQ